MCHPQDPLFTPPACSLRPPFHIFSFSRSYVHLKSQIFVKIGISKPQNRLKVQFFSPKFDQISVPRASNSTKNQFFKTPNLAVVHSLSPYLRPFRPHTHTKMKAEYTPPRDFHVPRCGRNLVRLGAMQQCLLVFLLHNVLLLALVLSLVP